MINRCIRYSFEKKLILYENSFNSTVTAVMPFRHLHTSFLCHGGRASKMTYLLCITFEIGWKWATPISFFSSLIHSFQSFSLCAMTMKASLLVFVVSAISIISAFTPNVGYIAKIAGSPCQKGASSTLFMASSTTPVLFGSQGSRLVHIFSLFNLVFILFCTLRV